MTIPEKELRIRNDNGLLKVFCRLRNKYVALTPEEYVRQRFVSWLIDTKHYPESLMTNETAITVNGVRRRCDTIVWSRKLEPLIIVEYKAPDVKLTQKVYDQIVRYNLSLRARFLIVSNGNQSYCCLNDYENNSYRFLPEIPDYQDLEAFK